MEGSLGLLLLLIGTLAIFHIVQAQSPSQQGFISLDCGLPANEPSPYKEESTGLQFTSDATFIQTGKIGKIQANREGDFLKPSITLRYFPDGERNCYNLKAEKGRNHLIRARFVYGNYDGRDISPKFNLYIGPNLWTTIDLERLVNGTRKEIIHVPTSNSLQICLVKTGETTPLISALEIRPMGKNSYMTKSGSLGLSFRVFMNKSTSYLRYPEDVYDRQWVPYFRTAWTQISTTSDVGNANDYEPPKDALKVAAIPTNASEPLTVEWSSTTPEDQYYLYAHFAEIQDLQPNETREFNILWNEEPYYGPFTPPKLKLMSVIPRSPYACDEGMCIFQLNRTNNSTLPPLLNAFEVYKVIHFPQSETDGSDVVAMRNIESTYGLSRINWQGDPCFPQQLRWDGLNCSNTNISTPPRITSLNLSSSGLTGTIAAAIQNLTQLEKLDLSNNNLAGEVPEFLGNMESLVFINISGNNLNGSIPQSLQRRELELLVEGNPKLCLSHSCRQPPKKKVLVLIVASVASAATIVIAVLFLFLLLKNKESTYLQGLVQLLPWTSTVNDTFANKKSRRFTYSEVIKMTSNFQRVLGRGGFGMVYHGTTLNGSQEVAVKVLSQSSTQGYKEFKAEVDLLLRVHYANLVSLVGYCYEGDHLGLIYEFLPNGDVKQHLSGKGGKSNINWSSRLRIALEAALGLEYLHIGCTPPMVHRDVKTANILLDENLKAKLADFGLSRSFQVGGESEDATVVGTLGYLDPEYYHERRLSEKSDVYSFGIVLLEMITNQPVINQTLHITQWAGFKINRGDITEIMDPNLCNNYDSNSAWRALELALSCANPSSSKRPSMSKVVNELKECIEGISKNPGLGSQEVTTCLDTSVVPRAR
uniref:non-specific serine/threonine protein kinase n=1 Tax=Noccaea caerulescens TaxID=107243 RepID=A0A1J3IW66_NOCCA